MSYCQIIVFENGKPADAVEFSNAWGGAARIWDALWNRYVTKKHEYDTWLTSAASGDRRLWDLAKHKDIPEFARAVHMMTFDRAIVRREHLAQCAKDLLLFVGEFPAGERVCHLAAWAEWINTHQDVEAIGFYMTSVAENLWSAYDEKNDCDVPYDLNVRDEHFEVYECLTGE